ncbi:acyl carrier protein [Streptomyces sp. NPDC048436]|uniref:acyl carrier protein n=1 Tax=Streptomyces sp. NPDC048436 TaxID=3365550 RepID=UPI0037131113
MADDTREQIHRFIRGRFPDIDITHDDDIFALGFINSLFAMELVMFIEKTFAFTIPNEELRFDNFRTVASIAKLVDGNRPATAGAPQAHR